MNCYRNAVSSKNQSVFIKRTSSFRCSWSLLKFHFTFFLGKNLQNDRGFSSRPPKEIIWQRFKSVFKVRSKHQILRINTWSYGNFSNKYIIRHLSNQFSVRTRSNKGKEISYFYSSNSSDIKLNYSIKPK